MSFNFTPPTTTANSGFSFGLSTTTAATGALGTAGAKPANFSFGATGGGDAGVAKPSLTFGIGAATAPGAAQAGAANTSLGGSFLGAPAPTLTSAIATPTTTAAPPPAPHAAPNTGAATTAATAPSFGFGGAPLAVATTAAPVPTTTAVPALSLAKTTAATLNLGTAPTTTTGAGFANLSTATKTTDSSVVGNAAHTSISYNQLEEYINKFTLELEEQEKVCTDQATQINALDKIYINNNNKILDLYDAIQKVKSDQHTLELELEFLATTHKELEETILQLHKEVVQVPQTDVEHSKTYSIMENLDTQLKQMSEDLKEIIDNLNEANKGQDTSDPIIQIGKILNAHMSSLQWIEQSSSSIITTLEDINKVQQSFKRDSERSFRSAYYN